MAHHAALPTAATDLTTFLVGEHHRLDALLSEAAHRIAIGDLAKARDAYRTFEGVLERHVRVEEELVFPLFEARTGFVGGPTSALRAEHREAGPALELMRDGLATADSETFRRGMGFFDAVRIDHCAKEEHILFPTLDRLLSEGERLALLRRLERELADLADR